MLSAGKGFVKRLLHGRGEGSDSSVAVTDGRILNKFLSDPSFPWLISFPRTGSHWLRMVMELYFEKPGLVRIFYYKDARDFTCYHRHDEDLSIQGVKNVIYLYRNPVDTIYSQLNYYKETIDDIERIIYWSELYGKHLSKWLFQENFTEKKTVITYEALTSSMREEFAKVCGHFGHTLDRQRLDAVISRVSKEDLKKKTAHDNQVVNLTESYRLGRKEFKARSGDLVLEAVISQDDRLAALFGGNQ